MSTQIDLDDGRTWRAANWAYDAVIEAIAGELYRTDLERELAQWLRAQTCLECGPGLGSVDVRELSPASRAAFRLAAQRAYDVEEAKGSDGWRDPAAFPGWISRFHRLLRMWEAIDRGEPPGEDTGGGEPTGRRVGPGWGTEAECGGYFRDAQ